MRQTTSDGLFPLCSAVHLVALARVASADAQRTYGVRADGHSSTAAQGYLDGIANAVGAQGHAALLYCQALIAREKARQMYEQCIRFQSQTVLKRNACS